MIAKKLLTLELTDKKMKYTMCKQKNLLTTRISNLKRISIKLHFIYISFYVGMFRCSFQ